jgi:homoserine dehydrogenase
VANTLSYGFIKEEVLEKNQKNYLYETNVGAGLPLIDTIKLLHLSGENITKIKGFLRTLSYLFNIFSKDVPFSEILKEQSMAVFTDQIKRRWVGNDVVENYDFRRIRFAKNLMKIAIQI